MAVWAKVATTVLMILAGTLGDGAIKDQFGYQQFHSLTLSAVFASLWLWLVHRHVEASSALAKKIGPGLSAVLIFGFSGAMAVWWGTEQKRTLLCQGSDGQFYLSIDTAWLRAQKRITMGDGTKSVALDRVQASPARYQAWRSWPEGSQSGTIVELDRATGSLDVWNSTPACETHFTPEPCGTAAGYVHQTYSCQAISPKF